MLRIIYPKRSFFTLCFLFAFTVGSLSALDGVFAGFGLEVNASSREGAAMGGGFSLGMDLNELWSVGFKAEFSHNMDTVGTLETAALGRLYIPLEISGLFAQAELGMSFLFENDKSFPAFLGGLAAGWRFNLGSNWYVEPMLRTGYPFMLGASVSVGYQFAGGE